MKRRSFLKVATSAAGATALSVGSSSAAPRWSTKSVGEKAGLPRRVLGRTGMEVSIVAFPGLAMIHQEQEACNEAVHGAFERGVNYFDVAPAYGKDGLAEIRLGEALVGLNRDDYYLACKTKMRDKQGARQELERSLKRLKTDYFDVYQLHCLQSLEHVEEALAPGGAMETILAARKEGKIRHIGFSAHTTKAALAALKGFEFDTAMFPISFAEYFILGFGKPVLELAAQQGVAVLAIKALLRSAWPADMPRDERSRQWWYRPMETQHEVDLAIRFTLSREPVVVGFTPAFLDLLDKAITAACNYRPISEQETAELRQMAKQSESVFRREEERFAHADRHEYPLYPESPHEGCPGGFV